MRRFYSSQWDGFLTTHYKCAPNYKCYNLKVRKHLQIYVILFAYLNLWIDYKTEFSYLWQIFKFYTNDNIDSNIDWFDICFQEFKVFRINYKMYLLDKLCFTM